jgi:ribose transport system substrate-binding protein
MLLQTANAANDRVVQERQVRTVVQGKSDFLIVDPLDVAGLRQELHAAVVSGIRLIVVGDFRLQEIAGTTVGVDYAQAGQLAGGILMRLLRGKGAVVEVEGVPGTQVAKELSLGARRGTGDAPGIRWTSRESAYFDRGKARSVITRHFVQNQRMDGLFAHDPAMLLGASESCRAKVPQPQLLPILVGFGYSADAEIAVRQGEASAMVYAPAMRWGEICVNTAVRLCRGETPGTFVPVDLTVLEH